MEQVSLEDLKDFFLTLPGSSVGADNDYNTNASVLCDIMRIISPRKVLHVADLTNTLRQIAENPQAYTSAFYPALRRYE